MRISSDISFGSKYIVSNDINKTKEMMKFAEYCTSLQDSKGVYMVYESFSFPKYFQYSYIRHTLSVPDSEDTIVENFCKKNGIKFVKYNIKDDTDL